MMKKIFRIILATAMIALIGYVLPFFSSGVQLFLGAGAMLIGLLAGILIENKSKKIFLVLGLVFAATVFALQYVQNTGLLQFALSGYMVYFACLFAFSKTQNHAACI